MRHSVDIRQAQSDHIQHIHELWLSRLPDILATHDPIADDFWKKEGYMEWSLRQLESALRPQAQFLRVATLGRQVVGFAGAAIDEDDGHVYWDGLVVAKDVEGQGVAAKLETARSKWAKKVARNMPVRVIIADGNTRSMSFFKERGFEPKGYARQKNSVVVHYLERPPGR